MSNNILITRHELDGESSEQELFRGVVGIVVAVAVAAGAAVASLFTPILLPVRS